MSPGNVSAIMIEASISASSIDRSSLSAVPSSSRCVWQSITICLLKAWRGQVQTDGGGFEPPVPFGTHAFQACTINRSVTHPEKSSASSESYCGLAVRIESDEE